MSSSICSCHDQALKHSATVRECLTSTEAAAAISSSLGTYTRPPCMGERHSIKKILRDSP